MTRPDPVASLRANPSRSAIMVDFDGSLAPIVDDPAQSHPLPDAPRILADLAARFGRVAVVSGRPVEFLRGRLSVEGIDLVGVYGMERWFEGEVVLDPRVQPFADAVGAAADELQARLPALLVERKGAVSCVLHWRSWPKRGREAEDVGRRVAEAHGLHAETGRMALELRPPIDVDKGTSVETLVAGMHAALFAGDDRGDLAAFDALERLVEEGRLAVGVKVAVDSAEAPAELLARADERVSGPEELLRLLGNL